MAWLLPVPASCPKRDVPGTCGLAEVPRGPRESLLGDVRGLAPRTAVPRPEGCHSLRAPVLCHPSTRRPAGASVPSPGLRQGLQPGPIAAPHSPGLGTPSSPHGGQDSAWPLVPGGTQAQTNTLLPQSHGLSAVHGEPGQADLLPPASPLSSEPKVSLSQEVPVQRHATYMPPRAVPQRA